MCVSCLSSSLIKKPSDKRTSLICFHSHLCSFVRTGVQVCLECTDTTSCRECVEFFSCVQLQCTGSCWSDVPLHGRGATFGSFLLRLCVWLPLLLLLSIDIRRRILPFLPVSIRERGVHTHHAGRALKESSCVGSLPFSLLTSSFCIKTHADGRSRLQHSSFLPVLARLWYSLRVLTGHTYLVPVACFHGHGRPPRERGSRVGVLSSLSLCLFCFALRDCSALIWTACTLHTSRTHI